MMMLNSKNQGRKGINIVSIIVIIIIIIFRSILPQYDKETKSGPKLILGDEGMAMEISKKSNNINFDDDDDIVLGTKPIPQSLKVELQEAKDFYTSTEYAQFQKPRKKKRRLRQKNDDDEEGGLASLESSLLSGDNDISQDRGSRSQAPGNTIIIPLLRYHYYHNYRK
jgi:hypothetical protein